MKENEVPEKIYIRSEAIFKALNKRRKESDIEYTQTDAFFKKAKEAFCRATCNGHPSRDTCTSLGTCKEYDNFVKFMKE